MPGQPPLDTTVCNIAVPLDAGLVRVRRSRIPKLADP
jgi:hypothetical protein